MRTAVDQDRWRGALVAEFGADAAQVPGRRVDTVFFGGGTPSLMPPETVAAVIETIGSAWRLAPGAEITLEANPTSVEAGRFRAFRRGRGEPAVDGRAGAATTPTSGARADAQRRRGAGAPFDVARSGIRRG